MTEREERIRGVSRRDILRVAGRFGMTSTAMALAGATGLMTTANLAQAAETTYEKRFGKEPKYRFKMGASGFNARNLLIERAGFLEFARDLEERTDGEIRIEFTGLRPGEKLFEELFDRNEVVEPAGFAGVSCAVPYPVPISRLRSISPHNGAVAACLPNTPLGRNSCSSSMSTK